MEKICNKCQKSKDVNLFYFSYKYNRPENSCKECRNKRILENKNKNPDKYKQSSRINAANWRKREREKIITVEFPKETHRVCKNCNTLKELKKDFIPTKFKNKIYFYQKCKKCRTHGKKSIRNSISEIVRYSLKRNKLSKRHSSIDYLGCSIDFFLSFLEIQFEKGMTFENYGAGRGKWSLDHYIPQKAFELKNEKEYYVLHNWKNFRPLWNSENSSKCDELPNGLLARYTKLTIENKINFINQRIDKIPNILSIVNTTNK